MSGVEGEELDEVREALAALRLELQSRLSRRTGGLALPQIELEPLFERLRERLQHLGVRERSAETDEFGMDAEALAQAAPLFDFLADRWWRIESAGLGPSVPEQPCVLVSNASGLLPWDALMVSHLVARAQPGAPRPRFLLADWLVTQPFAQPLLARLGGVRACRENAERLLRAGRSVVVFPEGTKGAAKVFRERYRLQRFARGGVVRLAIATGAPLVPVAVVGAEETHPVLFRVTSLARAFGLPFLPVTPTFPWLGPLGLLPLPARWHVRVGEPLECPPLGPAAADDELLVSRLNEALRRRIQSMVDELVRARTSIFW